MKSAKSYNSYKPSGISWVPSIPENWEIVDTKRCFNFPKEIVGEDFVNYKVLSLSVNGVIFRNVASGAGKQHSDMGTYQIIRPDSIVLCLFDMDVTPRIVGHSDKTGIITSAYVNIIPKENISSKYYYYYFILQDFNKYLFSQGTGIRTTLTRSQFGALKIALPSFEEQTAIARFLDYKLSKINRFIHKKNQLIKLLNEQKAAIINQAVTKGLNPNAKMKDSGIEWLGVIPEHWEVRKLKYVSEILRGKFTPRPRNDPRYYDGEYPFIQTGNLTSTEKYINTYSQTLNKLGYEVSKEFPINTVVMSVAANIADIAILNFKACFPDSVIGFKPFNNVDVDFLFYSLKNLRQEFFKIAIKSTQYNLNVDRVANVKIFLPDLSEQQQIVSHIEQETATINTTISKIEKELALTEEYKTALIAEAVTGKIDVRGYEVPEISEEETYDDPDSYREEEEISMAAEDAEEYQTLEE